MISYLIVGSGYRSEYYGRIAARFPDLFKAMYLCRSEEKAELMRAHTGMPATTDEKKAKAFLPDFVVVAVDRGHMSEVIEKWALEGYPVMSETPVGASFDTLQHLWDLQEKKNARIVSCEQYPRYPVLMAGIKAVEEGKLGAPHSAYLSLVHDYHASAVLRKILQTGSADYVLHGEESSFPVMETDSRYGAFYDGRTTQEVRDLIHISYASGKKAVYDFSSVEYRTYIRSRHLSLRCERGEWNDRMLYFLDEKNEPQKQLVIPVIPENYRMLDTQALRDIRRTWEGELQLDTQQDEFAIATMLLDMQEYLSGGPSPYPLQNALDDAMFWLLIREAVQNPWKEVKSLQMPWR